jgi:hypothetical protein
MLNVCVSYKYTFQLIRKCARGQSYFSLAAADNYLAVVQNTNNILGASDKKLIQHSCRLDCVRTEACVRIETQTPVVILSYTYHPHSPCLSLV